MTASMLSEVLEKGVGEKQFIESHSPRLSPCCRGEGARINCRGRYYRFVECAKEVADESAELVIPEVTRSTVTIDRPHLLLSNASVSWNQLPVTFPQMQELFLRFVSRIVHMVVPGVDCNEAVPLLATVSVLARTLRSAVSCSRV